MIKNISKFCLGTWSLGGTTRGASSYGKITNKEVEKILNLSFENGINIYDTASVYGKSEKILGKFIRDKRDKIKIATKVGCISYFKNINFKKKTIIDNINLSLKNLKTDYIDVCQLYNPNPLDKDVLKGFELLKKIQLKGKIKNIGVSLQNPNDYIELRKKIHVDMIQCNFNMLDQRILNNDIINFMKKDNVTIFARTVLNFGFFTENFIRKKKIFFKKSDHRSRWNINQINNWKKFSKNISDNFKQKIEDIAIRFIFSHKHINSAIIGVMNKKQLLNIVSQKNLIPLNKRDLKIINEIYDEFEKSRMNKPKIPMKNR